MARDTTPPPQKGIRMEFEKASGIIKTATGKKLQVYTESGLGYNNRIYYCQVDGEESYVLKVQGRFWTKIKTDTEVAGIQLAKQHTTIPVPEIMEWDSSAETYGHEYLLMTTVPGKSLDHEWNSLDTQQKQDVLEQLAMYVGEMKQNICVGSQIGNFTFGARSSLELGKTVEASIGPWDTYQEMIINQLENKLDDMYRQDKYAFLFRVFGDEVTELLRSFKSGVRNFPPAPTRVFTHGDLNDRNIMVTKVEENGITKLKIVGLLDFEWSGMFPCTEEYFASYEFLNSESSLKSSFFKLLEHYHVTTPLTIPHFDSHAKLIELREAITPWWITNNTSSKDKDACIRDLANALQAVKAMPRFKGQ